MVPLIATSDLHLGEPDSVLHPRYPLGIKRFVEAIARHTAPAGGVETLALLGDVMDVTLASWESCHTNMRALLDALLVGRFVDDQGQVHRCPKVRVDRLVYLPGNHDHVFWSDLLCWASPESVDFTEENGNRLARCGLGALLLKDSDRGIEPHGSPGWMAFDPAVGLGSEVHQTRPSGPFLWRVPAAGGGRPRWSRGDSPPPADAEHYSPTQYLISDEALATLRGFELRYPHLHTTLTVQGRAQDLVLSHGHFLAPYLAGPASAYAAPPAKSGFKTTGIGPVRGSGDGSDQSPFERYMDIWPMDLSPEFQPNEADLRLMRLHTLSSQLFERSPDSVPRALDQTAGIQESDLSGVSAEVIAALDGFHASEHAVRRGEDRSSFSLAKRLFSLASEYCRQRPSTPLEAENLAELESNCSEFMDKFWRSAENDDLPGNDFWWNKVEFASARWGDLSGLVWHALVGEVPADPERLPQAFGRLLWFYLRLCPETRPRNAAAPENLLFVFGDTHDPGQTTFNTIKGFDLVRAYNTGVWRCQSKNAGSRARLFVLRRDSAPLLDAVSLDGLEIRPFEEPVD